jgi:septum site-determining protein MinD
MSVSDVQEILSIPLLGIIPDDEKVIVATNRGEPLVLSEEESLSKMAMNNIVQRIEGKNVEFLDLNALNDTFFSKLRRLFTK